MTDSRLIIKDGFGSMLRPRLKWIRGELCLLSVCQILQTYLGEDGNSEETTQYLSTRELKSILEVMKEEEGRGDEPKASTMHTQKLKQVKYQCSQGPCRECNDGLCELREEDIKR